MSLRRSYSMMSKPVKASFWFLIMSLIQRGIQFLLTPIYIHIFSTDAYGRYSEFLSWYQIISIVASLSLANGVFNNGMIKYGDNQKDFKSSMQGLCSLSCIVTCLLFILAESFWPNFFTITKLQMCLAFADVFFYQAFMFWSMYQRFVYEYRGICIATILMALLVPIVSLLLFYLCKMDDALIYGYSAVEILIGMIFYVINIFDSKVIASCKYWKFAIRFNLPLIPHYLSGVILVQADRIMIGYYCGDAAAGIYSLAYTISLLLNIFISSINSTFVPWEYRKLKAKNLTEIRNIVSAIIILLGGLTIVFILVAPEMIYLIGTDEYYDSIQVIPLIMISTFAIMIYTLYANIEFYYEKTWLVMISSTIAAITNIVLNSIYIPIYGMTAAGYTTLISYLLYCGFHFLMAIIISKRKGILEIYNHRLIFLMLLGVLLLGMAIKSIYYSLLIRLIILGVIMLIVFVNRKKVLQLVQNCISLKSIDK